MKVLIGAPVRQKKHIFQEYLESLRDLEVDKDIHVHMHFVFNNCDFSEMLQDETCEFYSTNDNYACSDETHEWKQNNFNNVVSMKNSLLKKTIDEGYDFFFLVDSDLMLSTVTLQNLINKTNLYKKLEDNIIDRHIIGNIFWTRWKKDDKELPNAWYYDFYAFKSEQEISNLRLKGTYNVGYTGACILIHRSVIEKGVNYNPIDNVSFSIWEDRAFCIRAKVNGFNIYLDTENPCIHLYREEDYKEYKKALASY